MRLSAPARMAAWRRALRAALRRWRAFGAAFWPTDAASAVVGGTHGSNCFTSSDCGWERLHLRLCLLPCLAARATRCRTATGSRRRLRCCWSSSNRWRRIRTSTSISSSCGWMCLRVWSESAKATSRRQRLLVRRKEPKQLKLLPRCEQRSLLHRPRSTRRRRGARKRGHAQKIQTHGPRASSPGATIDGSHRSIRGVGWAFKPDLNPTSRCRLPRATVRTVVEISG